jgi:hypothetical protein
VSDTNALKVFSKLLMKKVTEAADIHTSVSSSISEGTDLRGQSVIKGTSVCYIWPTRDISMSLTHIGMLGKRKIATLVSLFSIYMYPLYKQIMYSCLSSMWWLGFCKQESEQNSF